MEVNGLDIAIRVELRLEDSSLIGIRNLHERLTPNFGRLSSSVVMVTGWPVIESHLYTKWSLAHLCTGMVTAECATREMNVEHTPCLAHDRICSEPDRPIYR